VTPHQILGVTPGATHHEIREAFHRLALHYHPDKVTHLGEEFERVAHEKFLELKEAYERLMTRRDEGGRTGEGRGE
jgi:DnaJ-class molecular chaperone